MHLVIAPKDTEVRLNWENGMAYCKSLTTHAHTDWRLPSIFELGQLIQEYPLEFLIDEYWSSTERWYKSPGAYFLHSGSKEPLVSCWKDNKLLVRAVRHVDCDNCK